MGANRFDQLAQALADGTSRRRLIALIGGGVLGLRRGTAAGAVPAACVDECAAITNQRAREACERICTRRVEAAASREARLAEARVRLESRLPTTPPPGTTAIPTTSPPLLGSCPAGRVELANGSCAVGCTEGVRCPDGCFGCGSSDPQSTPFVFCTAGFPPNVRPCSSTAECPHGTVCIGGSRVDEGVNIFAGLCQLVC